MAFAYITEDNIHKVWKDSEKAMSPLFDPLSEYERLARNRPHPSIDKSLPKVTDGTLSAIVQETPKRYIQQLPSGQVHTNLDDAFDVFANWKLNEDIIPNANCQADALQKSWRAGSNALTYGSQPAYIFLDYYEGELRANFKLPYITHSYLQKGKISGKECNVRFLEAWYQESDIDAIIAKEKELKKNDKEYKGEWDVKALEEIKDMKMSKAEDQKTPTEREGKEESNSEGVRIIHVFQDGVGNKFFSFSPVTGDTKSSEVKICRTKLNKDPRGKIPLEDLYCNLDLSNPLGRGIIELSGGMQNLLDSHTQAFQYMQALEMNPPLQKWGDMANGSIKYVPNAIIDMGSSNSGNKIEPFKISTQSISNFPNTYGLIKSQILNLNNSSDTSISAESGNPGFSKTDAGVNALASRLGVSDNYLRKQYESFWADICETMMNLLFAEMTGQKEENLDPKTADKLKKDFPEGAEWFVWKDVESSDTIIVDYDQLGNEPIYFDVDAGTSQVKEDQNQVESLSAVKELVSDMLPVSKRMQLANKFIYKLGIDDPDDVTFSKEELQAAQEAEQMQEEQAREQLENPQQPQQDMMQQGQPQGPAPEEEAQLAQALQERGFPEELIMQAIELLRQGYPVEQIVQVLQQQMQGVA